MLPEMGCIVSKWDLIPDLCGLVVFMYAKKSPRSTQQTRGAMIGCEWAMTK
jgi:hypothetical protein